MRTYPNKQVRKVAKYIETHGWCQGAWMDGEGRVCLRGALDIALPMSESGTIPRRRLIQVIRNNIDYSISLWNDRPGRTKDEVLDMLASIPE